MNLVPLPDGRILNLDHLVYIEPETLCVVPPGETPAMPEARLFFLGPHGGSMLCVYGPALEVVCAALKERGVDPTALQDVTSKPPSKG